ncbi:hypothetical protein BDN70DRAFT_936878 [Pholiota conissans]|uniref:C2H2-type domain-containing protein n=1 Tax=Pholiota conissans TaxID=109636 RepID=A0A9P6CW28_9AGAR|nr:hypothetical protein BDN70DRAFT_936878 [Pholiota conissans]
MFQNYDISSTSTYVSSFFSPTTRHPIIASDVANATSESKPPLQVPASFEWTFFRYPAPEAAKAKLQKCKIFRDFVHGTASIHIESLGPSHDDKAWKFVLRQKNTSKRGRRQQVLVCMNAALRPECSQTTPRSHDMDTHQHTEGHGFTRIPCEHCAKTFGRDDALKRHVRYVHQEGKENLGEDGTGKAASFPEKGKRKSDRSYYTY